MTVGKIEEKIKLLTYGVKGPHTIAERLRERGGQQPCHRLLALPPWLEL
jgi:hypothetical protein